MEKDQNLNLKNDKSDNNSDNLDDGKKLENKDESQKKSLEDKIIEFCLKVLPFSIGLLSLKSEVEKVLIFFVNNPLISFNFPLLLVPISSSLIFLFCI